MRSIFKVGVVSLWLGFCFTLSGCAVFNGGKVPATTLAPLENSDQSKPSISYEITSFGGLSGTTPSPEAVQHIIAGELLQTLEQSNYFSRISKNDASADLSLSVAVKDSGNPAALIPAIITGLSLYTIPSWATENIEVTATAGRHDGHSKEYVLSDSATLVQWLPMLFVFPVKNFSVIPEVRKNMYNNILSQMHDDGFIKGKAEENLSSSN